MKTPDQPKQGKDTSDPTDAGLNRTGVAFSPIGSRQMTEAARASTPTSAGDGERAEAVRVSLSREADPVGSVPPPATVKGAAKAAFSAIKGQHPMVFIDRLGERLGFERSGVRLYDAVLAKFEASGEHPGGPTREALEQFRAEELRHFGLLQEAMQSLGADPTAITPSADVMAVASAGIVQVLTDPRTTLNEALGALLVVELTDHDGWELLIKLARALQQADLAERFEEALVEEDRHLASVRRWLDRSVAGEAGVSPTT